MKILAKKNSSMLLIVMLLISNTAFADRNKRKLFINPRVSISAATFAGMNKQRALTQNLGYKSRSMGSLYGLDYNYAKSNLIGISFAISNSNINQTSNLDYHTRIRGHHWLLYGINDLGDNMYLDWLFTRATTRNSGSKIIDATAPNVTANFNYKNNQTGVRVNFGGNINFNDVLRLSPSILVQYSYLHQAQYDEKINSTVYNIVRKKHDNISTLGASVKLASPSADWCWWLIGARDVQVLVTYDIDGAEQVTVANFVAGRSNFTVNNNLTRLACKAVVNYAFELFKDMFLHFNYSYEHRKKYYDHVAMLKLRYTF